MNRTLQYILIGVIAFTITISLFIPVIGLLILHNVFFILQLIIFPIYAVIAYADIIYTSIISFLLSLFIGIYLLKKFYLITKYSFTIMLFVLVSFFGIASLYEATQYIKTVAKEKYHTQPTYVRINLTKWTLYGPFFGNVSYGSPHAEIHINDKIYHWSFDERDFIMD
jgi:hypothetical protein